MELGAAGAHRTFARRMSALDDIALSDPALKAWMARKKNPRPLVDSLSGIHGFVSAVAAGPRFPDPQYWLCPLMGLPADAMVRNVERNMPVIANVARTHNNLVNLLGDCPEAFEPQFTSSRTATSTRGLGARDSTPPCC